MSAEDIKEKEINKRLNYIIGKINNIEQKQNKILTLFKFSYILSLIYWGLIICIALGAYIYFKDLMLYIFSDNPSLDKIFKIIEQIYKIITTQTTTL